ncbi:MAG TPA: carboxypeptidase regulatory-like domain-containing protein [Bacteroidia bacterium]|nr:carboxypeptidase regulatory-like domain-containing protein [Bacteroidia bacterium]
MGIVLFPFMLSAQITSSSINGKIVDPKGETVPGVIVLATHMPTGTKYPVLTDLNGNYHLVNLNPGGPYTIKVSFIGFQDQVLEDINLSLGENQHIDFKLVEMSQQLGEVTVVGDKDDNKTGTATRISKEQVMTMPTITRSMSDFTRLTPQSSNNSFGGTNFRYNNVTIDGAANNDAIGFSPSLGGVSGTSNMLSSSTRTNAMSLDAIQDMSVNLAPFDVKLGNFTGGSINAVTRRGTNDISGSVYMFGRNASITGPNNAGDKGAMPSNYHDYQVGFRLGLPIIKDKLFFFTNFENTDRLEPSFFQAGQNGTFMTTAIAQQIVDSLKSHTFMPVSQYNPTGTYDPGAYDQYAIFSKSNKLFARVDWNINEKNQFSIRNNYVTSSASNLEQSNTQFQFGNYDFIQTNVNNATVAELKTRINNNLSNSLIAGATFVHDYRDPTGSIFPQVQINGVNGTGTILLGSNREASIFNMKQNTYEFTDNFTWFKGKNTFTFGTHNEIYDIQYGFINSYNGRIDYSSLSNFFANKPSRMRAIYNLGDDGRDNNLNNPSEHFKVMLLSAYAQDEIAITNFLKVSVGIRVDVALAPNAPAQSPLTTSAPDDPNYGTTYTHTSLSQLNNKLFGQPMPAPRVGFNWDVLKNKKLIIRGGSGLFTGRIPLAWLGYAYYNNGVNYGALDVKPGSGGVPSVQHLPTDPTQFAALNTSLGQPKRVEVDLIDNNFHMPQAWKSNLAVDMNLFNGYKLTLEGMYTQVIYDVKFQQVNLKDSVKYYAQDVNHVQPVYLSGGPNGQRIDNSFSSAYMLTNTNQGYRYQLTAMLSKQYKFGFNFSAAYTYGQSKDISNGIRNSFESNWQVNQSLNPNNPGLAYSNFDVRHRIVSTAGYKKSWGKKATTYLTLVFTGQSGSPYTWGITTNNKLSNTGQQVDLFYVPNSQSDINLTQYTDANGVVHTPQQQWNDLNNYISNDPYLNSRRGQYTERNGARTPWINQLDLRFMQDINFYTGAEGKERKQTVQITFDIINLTNLIDPASGKQYYVPNTINGTVPIGLTPTGSTTNNNPNYNFSLPTTTPYSINSLASRWQGQIGLRYIF